MIEVGYWLQDFGRIILGLVFFIAAIIDIRQRQPLLNLLKLKNIPQPELLLPAAIALKLICGFILMINFLTFFASLALAAFTLIANIIFHDFWNQQGQKRQIELVQFKVHLGIIAGFLLVMGTVIK